MSDQQGQWAPDPMGRHEQRWYDGTKWTEHVADRGQVSVDPMEGTTAPAQADDTATDDTATGPSEATAPAAETPGTSGPSAAPPTTAHPPTDMPPPATTAPTGGGVGGGLMGDGYDEEAVDRVGLQNSKMLKVRLGGDVMIKRGSMIAYQGSMTFEAKSEGGGLGGMLKRAVAQDNALMSVASGQGDLFLANNGDEVHLLELTGGGLMVNGPSLLAFESTLAWETVRFGTTGFATGGGLFGMKLQGTGWVAVTCHGTPVRLDTDTPTFVDAQAAVAWSAATPMQVNVQKLNIRSMRSGEIAQLQFGTGGFVLVQASEGPDVPEHSHS